MIEISRCKEGVRTFFASVDCLTNGVDCLTNAAILSPYNADVDGINEYCDGEFVRFHDCDLQQLLSVDEFIGGDVNQDEGEDMNTTYDERAEDTRIRR